MNMPEMQNIKATVGEHDFLPMQFEGVFDEKVTPNDFSFNIYTGITHFLPEFVTRRVFYKER